jgi:pimeloyl-ACP methyl ester carboxylesterase
MRSSFFLSLWFLVGCASWLPAPEPMQAVDHDRPGPRPACLLVLLPGGGDTALTFERQGVVDAIQKRGYAIDLVAVDAGLGYYARGVFAKRLADDVVRRRAARGYKQVWLMGNSLGGFGSLLYARQRPAGEVTGLFALSPYLGSDRELLGQIRAQTLAHWQAPRKVSTLNENNYVPELWRWLQAVTSHEEPGPELYLGYGLDEQLAVPDSLLAAALPRDHVYTTPGAHSWRTWTQLIERFLDDGPLASSCR